MTIESSQTLVDNVKIKYLCTLVRGEALTHFDTLSAEVGSTISENLDKIILGLGMYFPPVIALQKKRAIRRRIKKPNGLKVRLHAACMVDIDEYLSVFPESKASDTFVRRS